MTQALDSLKVLVLDGDGIGPEVNAQALRVLSTVCANAGISLSTESAPFGGASIDDNGAPVTEATLALAAASDAVLLGAVGGPKWDGIATHMRPEKGLLSLRSSLGAFANLRPAKMFAALEDACPLKPEVRGNVDLIVVRELIGGIYFGGPRGEEVRDGQRVGFNTLVYSESEIERIGRVAFETARLRDKRLTSVDKSNVLEVMVLWREVMTELGKEYPDVALSHMYVDNAAMQIIAHPSQFDVLVTGNMFGDILSDAAAALTGSLGMLPSAAMGPGGSVYEPVHGSAPDIAGQGKANPLAAILSAAMLLEHTAKRADLARQVENAVGAALDAGLRTGDIGRGATDIVSTSAMGDAVLDRL